MENHDFYTVRGYHLLKQHQTRLSDSLEDYLEMICRIMKKKGKVGVNSLANELNVKPSSASKMVIKLRQMGLILYEKYGVIQLTQEGKEIGNYLLWRHQVVRDFFEQLNRTVSEDVFVEAELSEHILSKNTVNSMESWLRFLRSNPAVFEAYLAFEQNDGETVPLSHKIDE